MAALLVLLVTKALGVTYAAAPVIALGALVLLPMGFILVAISGTTQSSIWTIGYLTQEGSDAPRPLCFGPFDEWTVSSLFSALASRFGGDTASLEEEATLRLVDAARAGNRSAGQRLYRLHVDRVFRTVRGILAFGHGCRGSHAGRDADGAHVT